MGAVAPAEMCLESVPEMGYDATATPARGELLLRGPCTFQSYLDDGDATRAMKDAEGWVHTGWVVRLGLCFVHRPPRAGADTRARCPEPCRDVVEITPSGALRIIDRRKHLIKLSQGERSRRCRDARRRGLLHEKARIAERPTPQASSCPSRLSRRASRARCPSCCRPSGSTPTPWSAGWWPSSSHTAPREEPLCVCARRRGPPLERGAGAGERVPGAEAQLRRLLAWWRNEGGAAGGGGRSAPRSAEEEWREACESAASRQYVAMRLQQASRQLHLPAFQRVAAGAQKDCWLLGRDSWSWLSSAHPCVRRRGVQCTWSRTSGWRVATATTAMAAAWLPRC